MANFSGKLKLQKTRFIYIAELAAEIEANVISAINIHAARAKLSILKINWEKFAVDHEKLVSFKSGISPEYDYFKKKWYEQTMKGFVQSEAALSTRIAELEAIEPPAGALLVDASFQGASHHRPSLPGISIPKFSGKFSEWRHFRDLFVSLVGENQSVSAVEKMHYLCASLEGDAASLIANLKISADSFASAWDTLTTRYENKGLLKTAHLSKLRSLSRMEQRTANGLNNILTTVSECVNALKALGCSADHWDDLLVYDIVQLLDVKTQMCVQVHLVH